MKHKQTKTGKIGSIVIGPQQYLHEDIKLGELAICIANDPKYGETPYVWYIGGFEEVIIVLNQVAEDNKISKLEASKLIGIVQEAKKRVPSSAVERLAKMLNVEPSELTEFAKLAQVSISAPVVGVKDFSTGRPILIPKSSIIREYNH